MTQAVDAVVLDLMLPGRHGLDVLRDLRARLREARPHPHRPGCGRGAGAGAGLRCQRLPRQAVRIHRAARPPPCPLAAHFPQRELFLRAGDLEMDLLARKVVRGGVTLELTGREYELLEYLLRHKNESVTREMIAVDVWKETTGAMTRIIDVYINALRKKSTGPAPGRDPYDEEWGMR